MLRGSWKNCQKVANGENSYQNLLFQISACPVKQKTKSHYLSRLNPDPLVTDPFSPRDSYCLPACPVLHNWPWLSACLGHAGCWLFLLAITMSDSRSREVGILRTLLGDPPFTQRKLLNTAKTRSQNDVPGGGKIERRTLQLEQRLMPCKFRSKELDCIDDNGPYVTHLYKPETQPSRQLRVPLFLYLSQNVRLAQTACTLLALGNQISSRRSLHCSLCFLNLNVQCSTWSSPGLPRSISLKRKLKEMILIKKKQNGQSHFELDLPRTNTKLNRLLQRCI